MPKTIESPARMLLFNMINKYEVVKRDINQKSAEKIQLLDSIFPLSESINNEIKLQIEETINKLKTHDKENMATFEIHYLEKISSMTDVSIKTLRRIKIEGYKNQGQWDTPGKKRPHSATVSNLDNFDVSAIRNKINEFYGVKKQVPTLRSLHYELIYRYEIKVN